MGRNREDLGLSTTEHERMETYGRRIMLEAKHGRLDLAKLLIDQYFAEDHASDGRYLEDVRLAEVLSDQQVVNTLDREFNCLSIGDLLNVLPQSLFGTPYLGSSRAAVLYQELAKFAVQKCRAQGAELAKLRGQPKCINGISVAAVQ